MSIIFEGTRSSSSECIINFSIEIRNSFLIQSLFSLCSDENSGNGDGGSQNEEEISSGLSPTIRFHHRPTSRHGKGPNSMLIWIPHLLGVNFQCKFYNECWVADCLCDFFSNQWLLFLSFVSTVVNISRLI